MPRPSGEVEQLAEQAGRYVDAAKAEATVRAYRSDWAEFSACADHRGLVVSVFNRMCRSRYSSTCRSKYTLTCRSAAAGSTS